MKKKGRLFEVEVFNNTYLVPKYIYDSYNQLTYFGLSHLDEKVKLMNEIANKFEKKTV